MFNRSYLKFAVSFLVIMAVVGGSYFFWTNYFSSQAKLNRETQANYQKYLDWEEQYKKAMREDTYGGKTPQETLDLFIEALKKEDVELASKYFMLDTNEQPFNAENYLTRKKWEEGLRKTKEAGKLQEVANLLSRAKAAGSSLEGYFGFEIRDENNDLIGDIGMIFNKESGVWKIESL